VVARRQDVREKRKVPDFRQSLVFVGKFQKLEVGVGDHLVVGLAALPAAEVETIGTARDFRVGSLADFGVPLSAVAAAPAGDVEGDRDQVTLLDERYFVADFDHFAGVLVPQDHSLGGREAAAVDVQVATANVRRHKFDDDTMVAPVATRIDELGVVEVLDCDFLRPHVGHRTVPCHHQPSLLYGRTPG
jgi:hypothetical protein